MPVILFLLTFSLHIHHACGFGVVNEMAPFLSGSVSPFMHSVSIASSMAAESPENLANSFVTSYTQALVDYPLETKMVTGAFLAVSGDAIAQSREDADYDKRRASSFMVFDMAYRALQHKLFPLIVQNCHGQYFLGMISVIPALAQLVTPEVTDSFAAMERTLASQLGIVPFMYYPVFFALTGVVQGLTVDGAVKRAQENFLPLMKRNLLFWIPVQFIQFGYVEENLQIPFLSVCGLCWTFILSVMAGSTKDYDEDEAPYCVTGMEDECELPDDLFPHEHPHARAEVEAKINAVLLKDDEMKLAENIDNKEEELVIR